MDDLQIDDSQQDNQNNKKTFLSSLTAKIILALIIFAGSVIIIISGAKFVVEYYKTPDNNKIVKQVKQTEQEKNKTDTSDLSSKALATDDWQTYQNEEFGFEVKYPKEWYFYNINNNFYFQLDKEILGNIPGPHANALEIKINPKPVNFSLLEIIQTELKINFEQENTTIGKINGLKVKTICEGVGCGAPEWFILKDGYIYHFDSNLGYSKIFDQIISTFKFIDQDEKEDWQTYRNKELGISFKYPSTWKAPEYIERFSSIRLNSYGSITIIDKNEFKNVYQQCLETKDEATCQKSFGRNYDELSKLMSFIESLQNKNLADNKYSPCHDKIPCSGIGEFNFGCNAIGGYITLSIINNDSLNIDTARTIGFCGYDVGIQNYYYYVPLPVNDKLIEIKFKLFPYNSAVYEWGNKEQGYDEAKNWEKFNNKFRKSLLENNLDELIRQKIEQYDLLVESIFLNRNF